MYCDEVPGFNSPAVSEESCLVQNTGCRRTSDMPQAPRSLYAALWHCRTCKQNVRVYSTLAQVISGELRNDCFTCGAKMETGSLPHEPERAAINANWYRKNPGAGSAWAA